ncbi:ROK family protein [Aquabacterium sp. J223]|uniref:ROK family protein n=1 Tax=Aquabacterium sp. J223 TaxID=2898431 RepID=UPI0021AE106F|nr:ROK family protein [Aquabacterium sp. J223]UUX94139.1 ROK family protein [Aquabacterium sp. J223]
MNSDTHPAARDQPAAVPALGVDLGGTKVEAVLIDADGRETWRRRRPTPAGDYDATLAAIVALVDEARDHSAPARPTLGIGTPGSATAAGLIKNANSTCLNGRPLQADLQARLGQPVAVANDANCLAASEAADGAGAGADVVFAAILGTGVGAGIVVHGRVLQGPNGLAGEWGHVPLPWATADELRWPCYCGRRGCVETLLSGPAIARDHEAATGQRRSAIELAAAALAGDATARATLDRHAERLARGLAMVIDLLDPDVIVLGGGVSRMAHLYEQVPQRWTAHVFSGGLQDAVRTRLAPALHGDASGVRGAAWLGRALRPT